MPNIVALVFDTTSSNSGIKKGAAKILEKKIGSKLLHFACRHHVLKIVVRAVWRLLFGDTQGPNNSLFVDFKLSWNRLNKQLTAVKTQNVQHPWLLQVKDRVLKYLLSLSSDVQFKSICRDDHSKCVENALIILGVTPPNGARFYKPGAIHQARWRASNLYNNTIRCSCSQGKLDTTVLQKPN